MAYRLSESRLPNLRPSSTRRIGKTTVRQDHKAHVAIALNVTATEVDAKQDFPEIEVRHPLVEVTLQEHPVSASVGRQETDVVVVVGVVMDTIRLEVVAGFHPALAFCHTLDWQERRPR